MTLGATSASAELTATNPPSTGMNCLKIATSERRPPYAHGLTQCQPTVRASVPMSHAAAAAAALLLQPPAVLKEESDCAVLPVDYSHPVVASLAAQAPTALVSAVSIPLLVLEHPVDPSGSVDGSVPVLLVTRNGERKISWNAANAKQNITSSTKESNFEMA